MNLGSTVPLLVVLGWIKRGSEPNTSGRLSLLPDRRCSDSRLRKPPPLKLLCNGGPGPLNPEPSSVVYWYSIGPRPKSDASSHVLRHKAKCVAKSREVGTCVPLRTLRVKDETLISYPLFSSWVYDLSLPTQGRKHRNYLACEILHTPSPSVGRGVHLWTLLRTPWKDGPLTVLIRLKRSSDDPSEKTPQRIHKTRSWCFRVSWSSSQLSWLPAGRKEGLP